MLNQKSTTTYAPKVLPHPSLYKYVLRLPTNRPHKQHKVPVRYTRHPDDVDTYAYSRCIKGWERLPMCLIFLRDDTERLSALSANVGWHDVTRRFNRWAEEMGDDLEFELLPKGDDSADDGELREFVKSLDLAGPEWDDEPEPEPEAPTVDLDSMTRKELQALARDYDDIKGNQSSDNLREALRAKLAE